MSRFARESARLARMASELEVARVRAVESNPSVQDRRAREEMRLAREAMKAGDGQRADFHAGYARSYFAGISPKVQQEADALHREVSLRFGPRADLLPRRTADNPAPTSKEQMWREFQNVNQTLIDAVDLGGELPADPAGYALFDSMERIVGSERKRKMRSFHEAFLAAVRSKHGKRPAWSNVDLDALQDIVDTVGVPPDCPRRRLVLPFDPHATRRGRAGIASAQLAADLAALGLTFDEALDELRRERAAGSHAFVSRNLVLDRLWRNVQAHLDTLEGPARAEFLASIQPRRLTGGSRSRASKFLVQRVLELNPATGDYLFDERSRVADRLPDDLEPRPADVAVTREPGEDDEGVPF